MKTRHTHTAKAVLAGAAMMVGGSAFAQTELDFWSWRQEDAAAYNEIIAAFEEANPDISVTYTAHPATEYNTIIATALAAGEGPDIIHTRSYGGLEVLANPGYLEPLDDKVDMSLISDGAKLGTTLRADGKVYAVPFASQTVLVFYNTDIFAANDITPPETWDEFKAVAAQLKDAGVIPLANGSAEGWMLEIMSGGIMPNFYGSEFFGEVTSGATDFEDPRYVGALEKMLELKEFMPDGYQGVDYATMKQLFASGAAAMFVGGSFEIPGFRDAGVNFDIMAGPAAEAGGERMVATWLDGGYAVNAGSENKEAALKFANFTASQEFGQMLTDKLGNISPIEGAVSSDPTLAKISEMHSAATPYIMLVAYRFNSPTGSTLLQNGLQEMFAGSKTPAEVANEVSEGIKASK
jgi:raffinose/stachyose/melibiose transport system substrate-binding protein